MGGSSSQTIDKSNDSNHPDNQTLKHEGWTSIQEKKRWCTDILFLLAIISAWIAMTCVGFAASGIIDSDSIRSGNVNHLLYATDYNGRLCGYSSSTTGKRNAYYLADGSVVCVSSCPSSTDVNTAICEYEYQAEADSSIGTRAQYIQEFKCMYQLKTYTVLNRCIPQESTSLISNQLSSSYNVTSSYSYSSYKSWFESFTGDVYNYRGIIFGFGVGVSTAIAFGYLYFLRIPGVLYLIIWGIIAAIQILLIVGSFLLWSLANRWERDGNHTFYEITTMKVFAYSGMAISVLYFCMILVLRKRIKLAIAIVKESARAIATIPLLMIMPIIQTIGVVAFMVPWAIYVFMLASSGEVKTTTYSISDSVSYQYKSYTYETNTKYAFLYMIFCYFWTLEFIVAIGQLVISLSIVSWYFTRDKATIGNHTLLWAFKTALLYHAGTAAFGSLIIAVVQTVRAVLYYIQKKLSKSETLIIKYCLCMLQCCLWCLEKFLKFINKNAYIQTAIYGYSFCKASRSAFFLLLRNILRVAAVNMVADFLLILGKFLVPAVTVFICYLVMAYGISMNDISGIVAPLVFVGLMAYYVSLIFSEIFGMTIETMLLCYIADEEMFDPADRYADGPLKNAILKTAQSAAANKIVDHVSNEQ